MASRACEGCGAALTIPTDASVATFVCEFCKREYRTADFGGAETRVPIDDVARAQRRLILTVAGALLVLIAVAVALFAMPRGKEPPPPPPAAPVVTTVAPAATPTAPAAPAPASSTPSIAKLELSFGGEGTGPGRFDRAHNLAVDRDGNVYVVDRTNRVQKFDAAGNLLSTFQVETKNEPRGELSSDIGYAIGIAVNSKREILVSIGYDILALSPKDGSVIRKYPGTPGVICYAELTVSQLDDVYAVSGCGDAHRYAIVKIGHDGRVERHNEGPSYESATTEKVAIDGAGKIFAPHPSEREIRVLGPKWDVFTRFGRRGEGPGEFSFPVGPLVLDGKGRLFARESSTVHVFDAAGKVLGRFETRDDGNAFDLAVGPHDELWALTGKQTVARYAVTL